MSNGPSPIRTLLPPKQTFDEALKRLEALEEWSQEPAKAAAASIELSPLQPAVEPVEPPQAHPQPRTTTQHPWDTVPQGDAQLSKSMNFKLPMPLYQKLKWLGETTYGSNMTRIVIEALEEKTARMLAQRGIEP